MADGSVVFNISADDKEAQAKLNQLRRDIEKTAQSIEKSQGKKNAIAEQLQAAREEAEKAQQAIRELQSQYTENAAVLSGQTGNVSPDEFNARKQAQSEILYDLKQQEAIYNRQSAAVAKLEGQEQSITQEIETQTSKMHVLQEEAGGMERALSAPASSALPQLREAIAGVTKQVKKSARSILKWGFGIRSAFILMRRLRSAIKEGIQAYAEQDPALKASLDSLKASLTGLKMAWGAAFAPIINAVAPMLQKLISLLATAAEYVQMFFAVLSGGNSYKKVISENQDLEKSYGGAGGAAADAKKEIMGFDEINKLNKSGGGGGGGAGGAGFDTEDVAIPQETLDKLTWVKDHLDEILIVAGAIGAALLAWKIAKVFGTDLVSAWSIFKKILGVILAIAGAILMVKNYIDAWNNGVNLDNLIGMLEGAALVVIGLGLAFGTTGAAIGLLITSVAMLVLGIREWITTGQLSAETFEMLEIAIAGVGLALSLLTGSWIPALIAGIVMIALAIYQNWEEIKKWLEQAWKTIKEWATKIVNFVIEAFQKFWNFGYGLGQKLSTAIRELIANVKAKLVELKTTITTTITNIKTAVVNKFNDIKNGIVEKFQAAKDKVKEIVDSIKDFFTNLKISPPHIQMPHITVSWDDCSQSSIARLLGITAIPRFSVQWYAKGGIVDGATLFGAGEAGKEAIVPLERNTEWIDMVVDALLDRLARSPVANGSLVPPRAVNGSMFSDADIDRLARGIANAFAGNGNSDGQSIKLYLDGRQIAETVTTYQRRFERGYA